MQVDNFSEVSNSPIIKFVSVVFFKFVLSLVDLSSLLGRFFGFDCGKRFLLFFSSLLI